MSRWTAVAILSGASLAILPLAGLLPPAPLAAQAAGQGTGLAQATGVHTVQRGETLSQIAQDRLGSAGAWRSLWELNRDRVPNPDRIAPGLELRLPGATGTAMTGVAVQDPGAPARMAATSDFRERQALLERRRFEPRPAPQPDSASRTIFYGTQARQVQAEAASQVLLVPETELPVVQPGVARASGWILSSERELGEVGQLRRFAVERALRIEEAALLIGDEAVFRLAPGSVVRPGDIFTTVRTPRAVQNVGLVVVPTGQVEVHSVEGDEAVVRVTQAWDPVKLGQFVVPHRETALAVGVAPRPATRALEGRIIAFEEPKEIYLVGDRLFLDLGQADGLSVGDRFVGVTSALASEAGAGNGATEIAHFQVVRVQEGTSTLRITRTVEPREVRVGARLLLTASMP